MSKSLRTILISAIFIVIIPALGIPNYWKNLISVLLGALIIVTVVVINRSKDDEGLDNDTNTETDEEETADSVFVEGGSDQKV